MSKADFNRIGDLFVEARELPPGERAAFLDTSCGDDAELRTEVESLLAADVNASMLDNVQGLDLRAGLQEIAEETTNAQGMSTKQLPEQIGQYRIVRKIGQGGMGMVYEAEQDSPKRTVALKVLSAGMQSAQLLSRFRREADVLGRLHHPGIAQVYQSGVAEIRTDAGVTIQQPYFALELISGEPLDTYARKKKLTVPARLKLFAKICDAVDHAHEQGVIHRDLKPTNILVDQHGQPKILDFGVARATDADLQSVTLQTEVGQLVGTLSYMSPEQTGGDSRELDNRSDVYALGVILYELLAGELPCGLRKVSIPDVARVIREVEPTRLGSVDTHFRGDVETIATKALEKDRTRRYPSAAELASDIRRHLSDEPIQAQPVSTLYQLRKFARRNRGFVAGIAMTFLALVVGLIGTVSSLLEARVQRDAAVAARAEAEQVTEFQAKILSGQTASDFGESLLTDLRSEYRLALEEAGTDKDTIEMLCAALDVELNRINGVNIGRTVLSHSQAERAVKLLKEGFTDNPVTEARLRESIGSIYERLGMYSEAIEQFDQVLAIRQHHHGIEHPSTLDAMHRVAVTYRHLGQTEKAEPLFVETLALRQRVLGDDHRGTLETMAGLSRLWLDKVMLDEAEDTLTRAYEASKRTLGENHDFTLDLLNELCLLHLNQGRYEEAIENLNTILALREEQLGPDHSTVIDIRSNLVGTYFKMNRLEDAEPIARDLVASSERIHGRGHPDTIMVHNNLGIVLLRLGKLDEAEELLRGAYKEAVATHLSLENEVRMKTTSNLIDVLLAQGNPIDAEEYCHELLQVRRAMKQSRAGLIAQTLEQLGWACFDQKRFDEAHDVWKECAEIREKLSYNHWLTNRARSEYGMTLTALEQYEEAEQVLTKSYEALVDQRGEIPPGDGATCIKDAGERIVELYQAWGKPEEANHWEKQIHEREKP